MDTLWSVCYTKMYTDRKRSPLITSFEFCFQYSSITLREEFILRNF